MLLLGNSAKAQNRVESSPRALLGSDSSTPAAELNNFRQGAAIETAPGSERGRTQALEITVYLQGQGIIPQMVLWVGKVTATEIFRQAGVRLVWSNSSGGKGQEPLPYGRPGGPPTAVRNLLLTFSTGGDQDSLEGPLASSRPYAPDGVQVMVFYDRVRAVLNRPPAAAGKILGHVLAHEIAHVLQGVARHSETGVMKANWSASDICAMSVRPLAFTPRDIELLHIGMVASRRGASANAPEPMEAALKALQRGESGTAFDLDQSRPSAVPLEFRARARSHAPREGWIQRPNEMQRHKLTALDAILRAQQRESVYEVRVYQHPEAYVQAQNGAVLLISTTALQLLDATELQALVAHELGHEYVAGKFNEAVKRRDNRRRRELELFCDGVALLTLRRVGADPLALLTALEKIMRFNRNHVGEANNPDTHPPLSERKTFAGVVLEWAAAQEVQGGC